MTAGYQQNTDRPRSAHVRWVEAQFGCEVPDDIARCIEVMSAVRSPHNWWPAGGWRTAAADFGPLGTSNMTVELHGVRAFKHAVYAERYNLWVHVDHQLSTFDGSELTRLVRAAHEHHVRVAISPGAVLTWSEFHHDGRIPVPRHCLEIQLTPRSEAGSNFERHPGMEALR